MLNELKGSGNPAEGYTLAQIKDNPTYLTAVAKPGGGLIKIGNKDYTVVRVADGILVKRALPVSAFEAVKNFFERLFFDKSIFSRSRRLSDMAAKVVETPSLMDSLEPKHLIGCTLGSQKIDAVIDYWSHVHGKELSDTERQGLSLRIASEFCKFVLNIRADFERDERERKEDGFFTLDIHEQSAFEKYAASLFASPNHPALGMERYAIAREALSTKLAASLDRLAECIIEKCWPSEPLPEVAPSVQT